MSTPDQGITWIATPSEALQDGRYGVKWSVAAPDAHPKTGSFRFTVDLPVAAAKSGSGKSPAEVGGAGAVVDTEGDKLASLLVEPDVTFAQRVGWFGSALGLTGAILGIGGLAFLGWVMVGRRSEVSLVFRRVRWSGAIVILGTGIQVLAQSAVAQGGDWATAITPVALGEALDGAFGWSILLRLFGGVLIVVGSRCAESTAPKAALATTEVEPGDPVVKASLRRSTLAIFGAGLYLVSFLFDGHTATQTPLVLVWATDIVHVLAAATWVGGIAMLATVLWRRKRTNRVLDAAYIAVRFSVVAGASLVLAGIAGIGLTVEILEQPSQLWESTWGQILIAKVLLVTIVAAIGAYNHFRIIPTLEQVVDLRASGDGTSTAGHGVPIPTDSGVSQGLDLVVATPTETGTTSDRMSRKLWLTAFAEVAVLIGVIGLTARLVGSSANI